MAVNMGHSGTMKTGIKLFLAAIALAVTAPVVAQGFSDGFNFLKAVKERNGTDAEKYLKAANGGVIVNTKNDGTGETALHIVAENRYDNWTGFLLQHGANPNLADKQGVTPLMVAVRSNFPDAVDWLLKYKAKIDQTNRKGETALVWAVQLNKPEMVRVLMRAGANADRADFSGQSARDYATNSRASGLLAIIESKGASADDAKKSDLSGLDFSGVGNKPAQ